MQSGLLRDVREEVSSRYGVHDRLLDANRRRPATASPPEGSFAEEHAGADFCNLVPAEGATGRLLPGFWTFRPAICAGDEDVLVDSDPPLQDEVGGCWRIKLAEEDLPFGDAGSVERPGDAHHFGPRKILKERVVLALVDHQQLGLSGRHRNGSPSQGIVAAKRPFAEARPFSEVSEVPVLPACHFASTAQDDVERVADLALDDDLVALLALLEDDASRQRAKLLLAQALGELPRASHVSHDATKLAIGAQGGWRFESLSELDLGYQGRDVLELLPL
eukprot:scaffold7071_cov260-Pinguiococcus_pyrenoidosus.AAC.8